VLGDNRHGYITWLPGLRISLAHSLLVKPIFGVHDSLSNMTLHASGFTMIFPEIPSLGVEIGIYIGSDVI